MVEKNHIVGKEAQKAYLIGVANRNTPYEKAKEYIEELAFLAETADIRTMRSYIQNLDRPNRATYIGSGKLIEIRIKAEEEGVSVLIFDDELSPMQLRNIEKETNLAVLDRSALILHIFDLHAQTAQARLQVELAQNQYMLPRLTRLWTHLERQRGGTGTRGGAGEKEIETDRRIIRDRIALLKKELEKITRQDEERRKNRGEFVRIALIGYTNVGKSTLMNALTKSEVLVENKLFATLDTTVRKMVIDFTPFLISDTVGFIRKLPHHLVECFKSTLAEAKESDILLHVVDVSHPQFLDQIKVVQDTLKDLKIENKREIIIFNKIDALSADERETLETAWFSKENTPSLFISALKRENIEDFRKMVVDTVRAKHAEKFPNQKLELYS